MFEQRYRPIIAGVLRRMGIEPRELPDLAQDVLLSFVRDFRADKYDRDRGRLRGWIAAIARNRARDFHRRASRTVLRRGESAFEELSAAADVERLWDEECARHKVRTLVERLKRETGFQDTTFAAFELVQLQGRSAADAARELDLSISAVYVATHRCRKRLAELRPIVDAAFGEDGATG